MSDHHNAFSNPAGNAPSGLVHDEKELKGQHRDQPVATHDRMGTGGSKTAELGKLSANSVPGDNNFAGLGKGNANPGDVAKRS